jgi:hypothetical protein
MINLNFHVTHSYAYPVPLSGGAVGMTVCEIRNDPCLAVLVQSPDVDDVSYLDLLHDHVIDSRPLNTSHQQVSGLGWNAATGTIWAGSGFETVDEVLSFDPATHDTVDSFQLPADVPRERYDCFATNGAFMVFGVDGRLELRMPNGTLVGQKTFPGRRITGLSASPMSWVMGDRQAHELVVINPLGGEMAVCPAPGPGATATSVPVHSGVSAVTVDMVTRMRFQPQLGQPEGQPLAQPGSPYHAATPWNPTPWGGRHRIYVANDFSQRIYGGYFIEA